jgi:hypothetical protein
MTTQIEIPDQGSLKARPSPFFTQGQQCWVKKDKLYEGKVTEDYRPSFDAIKVRLGISEWVYRSADILSYDEYVAEKLQREREKLELKKR